MKHYDLIVIGGGPGGYKAAITAAKKGSTVAIVEESELGGTCLNRGCIPSKTMLKYSEVIHLMEKAKAWGIEAGPLRLSFEKMKANKDNVIQSLRNGVAALMKARKIEVFRGHGTLIDKKKVRVDNADDEVDFLTADQIILATGSRPFVPPIPGADSPHVHTSDTIFDLAEIPKDMVIVGGGIIGVECAAIFSAIGARVSVVEMQDRILSTEDHDVSKLFASIMKRDGVEVFTEHQVSKINETEVILKAKDGKEMAIPADTVLVSVGRRPNVPVAEHVGIKMKGPFVEVNERMETSIDGIYAVGDLIGGIQLAHVAEREGEVAGRNVSGAAEKMDYKVIPRCIYTHPEIASVGLTETMAKEKGLSYKTYKQPLSANSRAVASGDTDGFAKLIVEPKYGEILGMVLVGGNATELINEGSAFLSLEGTADELAAMIHPHPSYSESIIGAL